MTRDVMAGDVTLMGLRPGKRIFVAVTRGEGMTVEPFEATVMEVLADGMVRIAELPDMAIRVESVFDTETEVREAFAPREVEDENPLPAGGTPPISQSETRGDLESGAEAEADTSTGEQVEPQPIGRGAFGNIYDAFKGKVKEAVNFLLRRKEGEAVGALHHNEIGDISLVYGTEGYGLLHIVNKHPEILDDLQGVISGMAVVSQSDNRIILESPTHRAVVSKMLGNDATGNWLLTAYEKKSPVSVSSSDIETEPVGMQNGTAPLQNETSGGEVSNISSDMQAVPLDLSGVAVGDVIHYGAGGYSGTYEVTRIDAEGTVWIRNVKGGEEQAVSEEDRSDFYGSLDDAIDVATGVKVKAAASGSGDIRTEEQNTEGNAEVGNPLPASGTPPISQSETRGDLASGVSGTSGTTPIDNGARGVTGTPAADGGVSGSPLSAEETPSGIPLDGNGEPMYESVDVAVALDDLLNNQGLTAEEAAAYVANRHADAQARYDELQANPPKMGSSVAEYRQAKAQWQSEVGAAEGSLMFWSSADYVMRERVAGGAETEIRTEEQKDNKENKGGSRDARPVKRQSNSLSAQISRMADKYGEPSDLRNFVLKALLSGGYKFRWSDKGNGTRGLASHLGLRGRAEMAQRLWLLNSGGLSPEAVAERIEAEFGRDEVSTADVLNEILDILRSTPSRQGMYEELRDYYDSLALENDAEARQAADDRELAEDLAEERGFASVEEMDAYEEVVYAELEEAGMTDAEYEKYSNFVAEQILIEENERRNEAAQSDEQNGDNGVRQGGGEILSEPQVDDDRGDETVAGRPAAADVSDDNADGASQAGQDGEVAEGLTDSQGNPVDAEGRLVLEEITLIDQLTDEDFTRPTRSVRLPALPGNVDNAIGANGKAVIIKKNIFEKNAKAHKDLSPDDSRLILSQTLYAANLYGQNRKTSRPYNWILVHLADKNTAVIIEVNGNKEYLEIVNWHYLGNDALKRKISQAEREGGLILTLESAAANTSNGLTSEGEVTQTSADMQASTAKKPINNLSELRAKALERGADPERLDRYERMPLTVLRKQAKNYEGTLRKVSPVLGAKLQAEYDYVRALIAEQERNKKNNKWGVKVGNTATPFEVVRAMFEEWNSDADVAALMDKVAPIFEKLPVKIMFSDTIGGSSTQGYYKAGKGELRLPGHFVYSEVMSNQQKAQAILHEMIHAVTSYALYVDEMPALQSVIGMSLTPEMRKAVDTLRLIFSRIKTDPAFRGEYGATDVHEMVAELSNPEFRAKLREKGLWQQVVDAIKRLLGIEVKNALDGAEGALQKMLDNFDRTQWDKLVATGRKHASMADGLVDRMFIGERGAAEADRAEEANHRIDNLAVARDMEAAGKDAGAIKMATGWERGADGKWRYEVEDFNRFDPQGNLLYERRHPDYTRYRQLNRKHNSTQLLGTEPLTEAEMTEYQELAKKWGGITGKMDNTHTLEAYIDAPELFEAYPRLRDIKVEFTDGLPEGVGGRLVAGGGDVFDIDEDAKPDKIYISNGLRNNQSMLNSVVTHEIQHAIQHIEGFAKGGSTQTVRTQADELKADASRLYEMMLETPEWGEYQRLFDRWFDLDDKTVEARMHEIFNSGVLNGIIAEQDRLRKKYGYNTIVGQILSDPIAMDAELWDKLPDDFYDKVEAYHRLAGEVEARNASARMGMSAEERRATLASETEDVAREDQIFIMGNSGVSEMAESEMNDLIAQMKSNASVAPFVEINEENWVESVETPIGNVKMGEHQKTKLFERGRENQYGMLLETLSDPDIVLEEKSEEDPTHERDSVYLFIKTFQKEDGSKYVHFESVTVKQDGLEVSISSHIIRENQLRNKMKSDRLLYKATALDQSTNSSAEQSIKGGSLSSTDKGSDNFSDTQEGMSDVLARPGDVFYSNAERAVLNIKQEKATPQQWLAMIEKQGGLKAGEDKWLGLSDWLKSSTAKTLSKQEVLDYIAQNQIVVEEVRYGTDEALSSMQSEFDELTEELGGKKKAFEEMVNRYGDDFDMAVWYDAGGQLHFNYGYEDYGEIIGGVRGINSTRLEYTTEGLENNKEIALVVPTVEPYNQSDEIHFGDAGGGRAVAWVRFGEARTYEEDTVIQEVTEFHEPYKNINGHNIYKPVGAFKSGDFIAHGRSRQGGMIYMVFINDKPILVGHNSLEEAQKAMNEYYKEHPRRERIPKRVLVIDEIQSKRHQDGREKGYRDANTSNQIEEAKKSVAEAERVFAEFRKEMQEKYDFNSLVQGTAEERRAGRRNWKLRFTPEEMIKYDQLHDATIDARNALEEARQAHSKVPDAPFDKNWHELAMKRMLRYAAENGFDKVAWTTGAQQAERYSLGGSVDTIVSNRIDDNERMVHILTKNEDKIILIVDNAGVVINGRSDFRGKILSDILGKELSETILLSSDNVEISGGGLFVGGEGMKGFYDKMLPNFMNKYGKKWGVKVGEVTMPELQEGYQTMHSIDVTAEMRASVMEGQPLFRPGDSLAAVNERFNEELDGLTEENADNVVLMLGNPSEILLSAGVENKPMKLYGNKVIKKMKKHGFSLAELRDLPRAVADPIAVFNNYGTNGNRSILTELRTAQGNFLVTLDLGKGVDVDFNVVSSVFGKGDNKIVTWINEGLATYINKTKALEFLFHHPAPIAGTAANQELDDAAKIVENFENPTIGQENNAEIGGNAQTFAEVAVSAGEKLGVKVVVDPTMGSKGSYNLSTGEVRVNPNAHLTEADVERTVVHEVIGHGGMQALLGERFDEICANVYAHMSEEQRADIRRRHGKELSNAEVGAEYMAETAERMASGEQVTSKLRQLWERVKGWIRDAVRRRGIAVAMSDADIRYMIATASRKAREGKLQEMIDHAVETRRLRRAAMSQDAMESQLSQPLMRPRDSEDASQLASGVAGLTDAEYVQQSQLEEVARRVAGRWGGQNKKNRRVRLRTNMIDASHPIHKVLQQMYGLEKLDDVEKTLGYGERNAYMMRERAASRAADRVLVFRRQVLAPLNSMRTDFVKALAEEFGIKLSEALALSKVYFASKTGLERQRVKEETAEDGAEDRDYAGLGGSMIWLGALLRHWNGAELPPIDWVAEAERRGYHDTLAKGWKKGSSAVAKLTENRAAVEEILAAHGYPTLEEWVDYVDGLSIEASAAKGDIGMSRFGTADMWSIIQGVSRTMLEGQVKAGLLSAEGYQRLAFGDTFANIIWRKELAAFFSGTHHGVLHLGATSPVLMACGLNPQTLYITSKTLRTHVNKHGLTADDLMDLPEALRNPLMVYEWGTKAKSLVIITELQRGRQRITVAVKLERGGEILEVNEVASVHGKDASRFLDDMKNAHAGGFAVALRWLSDKKDVLHWLGIAPPKGAAPQTDEELIAKVITDFTNPDLTSVKLPKNGINYWTDSRQLVDNGYMTEEVASKKTA